MSELICETVAHRAGFAVSVGNWISPDGSLILGPNYDSHHWETLSEHLEVNKAFCEKCGKSLTCMNMAIDQGFIRLIFRADICFQVGAKKLDELWSDAPHYKMMMSIINKLDDVEMHIFSKKFYVIGQGVYIARKELDKLQIRT